MLLTDLVRRMFRKAAMSTKPTTRLRNRLNMEQLESREVPATITGFISPSTPVVGDVVNFAGSLTADPFTSASETFDWGDGVTTSNSQSFSPANSSCQIWSSHSYTSAGSFTLTVTATATLEAGGTDTATATFSITVDPTSPPPPPPPPPPVFVTAEKIGEDPEEGGTGTVRVARTGDLVGDLTVNIDVSGTATAVSDYNTIGTTVTILAGQSYADVAVVTLPDNLIEGDEDVTIAVTIGTGYTVGTPDAASVIIHDDPPIISVGRLADGREAANPISGAFRVTRAGGDLSQSLSATYTMTGTATQGADYSSLSGSVTINPGDTYADVVLPVIDDALSEPTETAILTLDTGSNYLLGTKSATIFIWDNDGDLYVWQGSQDTDWMNAANWLHGGFDGLGNLIVPEPSEPWTVPPGASSATYFSSAYGLQDSILHGPLVTGYGVAEMHMLTGYPYRAELQFPLNVGSLEMLGGIVDQPYSNYGSDLKITGSALWTDGILNNTSNLANVIFFAATAEFAPAEGSGMKTGSNLNLIGGASVLQGDGQVVFDNDAGIDVGTGCALAVAPNLNTTYTRVESAGVDGRLLIESGGMVEVYRPDPDLNDINLNVDWKSTLPIDNSGGKFWVHNRILADIKGEVFATGNSILQTGATSITLLESGSTIKVEQGFSLGAGKFATAPLGLSTGQLPARVLGNMTNAGASIEINDPAYSPAGTHIFGALSVEGDVVWTGGPFRVYVGWTNAGIQSEDRWMASDFKITATAGGATLGPAPIVNLGNRQTWDMWTIISAPSVTITVEQPMLRRIPFELAEQGNNWENWYYEPDPVTGQDVVKLNYQRT